MFPACVPFMSMAYHLRGLFCTSRFVPASAHRWSVNGSSMPPAYPTGSPSCLKLSRRCGIRLLLGTPCVLLISFWLAWRWTAEFAGGATTAGEQQQRPGVLGFRTRGEDGGDDPELDDWYPIPNRIEPIRRVGEVEEYLTGPDMLRLLEEARLRNTTAADLEQEHHDTVKIAPLANVLAAEALGDNDVLPVTTAFAPGWEGMPTSGGRCSSVDMATIAPSMACGGPLGQPCFDHGRCRPRAAGGPGLSIYVFDATCSLANSSALPPSKESLMLSHTWREMARAAGVLSESYWDACLFVHVNKRLGTPCPAGSPLWNEGRNHVMVDFTDRTRDMKQHMKESFAMDASSNMRSCFYRSGYDFAVPLRHQVGFGNTTYVAPWHREYFLTVKGSLYLSGTGYDERMSVVELHSEPDGVVMALSCFDLHDEHLLPQNEDFCVALNETASRHEYEELMNTTFGLVPAGRSPATYRLAEVMSAGAIPVFVARDIVKPFPERVDWSSLSFSFPPEEVGPAMMDTLRSVPPAELLAMQRKSVEAFLDIFGEEPGYDRIASVVIDELVRRVGHHR